MSAARRRMAGAGGAALLLALGLAAAAVVGAVGARYNVRLDVTSAGEQRLAPRTLAVLEQAAALGEVEILVAADAASLEPWARRAVRDVLELFEHSGRVRAGEIDVGSAEGQAAYGELLGRLIEREREGIDLHIAAVAAAAAQTEAAGAGLEQRVAPGLLALRDLLGEGEQSAAVRSGLEQWASLMRAASARLSEAARAARAALAEPDAALPIPPLERHEAALRQAVNERATELDALVEELEALGGSGVGSEGLRSGAESLGRAAAEIRDELARAADGIARLPRLDVLRIATALGASEIALVIGPPGTGVAGIDIGTLYEPDVVASDGTRITGDVRFQAEELLASAVSTVLTAAKPIVVLTHGESASILDSTEYFAGVGQRMARRGIDLAEWQALHEPEPPELRELDPDGARPRVYAVLAPDSSGAARSPDEAPGPERAAAVGRALQRLIDDRAAVLLSVIPSVLPSYGETDPVAAPLAALGVDVRTGVMLLRREASARAQELRTEFEVVPGGGGHAILGATSNLPTLLSYPVPIEWSGGSVASVTPLLTVEASADAWGETQWVRLWQTPREQRPLLPERPGPDEGVDDTEGPWTVGAAVERAGGIARTGRIVVVGSSGWFFDPVAARYQATDGRVALAWPGNAELFEAAVLWLAGQDELIAQSAGARSTPLVGPIEPGRLRALRWGLVAGLPLLTLGVGVAWRVVRG
ncbi:MAG TPA: hypothetical protein VFF69_04545 [Phycisphaerales bacterium]|nr:hypothetical protein [Phycisphaerales bacterium]